MSPGARPRARWVAWFLAGLGVGAILGSGVFAATADPGTEALPAGSDAPAVARFGEETIESGIRHDYGGGFNYFVGGGVAVFDCDDDRKADVYLAGGEGAAALYRNASEVAGELQFVSVDSDGTDLEGVVGAYPVDVDSDSVVDLAVLRVGENVMLRGLGDCRFERANEAWGIDGGNDWTAGFSATWEEGSTLPTLAFGNYLEIEADDQNARDCVPSALHRPAGQLTYGPPVPLAPGLCTLSVLFSDWNAQGRHDLRMANDRHYYAEGGEQLWRLDPGREPALYTASEGWEELSIWGMGLASGDVTGDHLPEVVITSQGDNKLQTLAGDPSQPEYTDIAIRAGASAHRPFMGEAVFPSTAWHPELADVNNDGVTDLYLSKGNVDAQGDHAADDPSNLLLGRADGTFVESAREAGVVSLGQARGAALADFNLDGLLDLIEVNRSDNVRVWRNLGVGEAGEPEPLSGWLALDLQQRGSNVDAIGAWVEVKAGGDVIRRQVTVGGGHAGGKLGWVHVGLGDEQTPQVRIVWPDGEVGEWLDVNANQFVQIERGAEQPIVWIPS